MPEVQRTLLDRGIKIATLVLILTMVITLYIITRQIVEIRKSIEPVIPKLDKTLTEILPRLPNLMKNIDKTLENVANTSTVIDEKLEAGNRLTNDLLEFI